MFKIKLVQGHKFINSSHTKNSFALEVAVCVYYTFMVLLVCLSSNHGNCWKRHLYKFSNMKSCLSQWQKIKIIGMDTSGKKLISIQICVNIAQRRRSMARSSNRLSKSTHTHPHTKARHTQALFLRRYSVITVKTDEELCMEF